MDALSCHMPHVWAPVPGHDQPSRSAADHVSSEGRADEIPGHALAKLKPKRTVQAPTRRLEKLRCRLVYAVPFRPTQSGRRAMAGQHGRSLSNTTAIIVAGTQSIPIICPRRPFLHAHCSSRRSRSTCRRLQSLRRPFCQPTSGRWA